jgi:hypothetical protein
MPGPAVSDGKSLASTSVVGHVARGAVGFGLLAGSLALAPVVGLLSLALVPMGVLALRGCPACWVIGLAQAISRGRLERSCVDGRCQLNTVTGSSSL